MKQRHVINVCVGILFAGLTSTGYGAMHQYYDCDAVDTEHTVDCVNLKEEWDTERYCIFHMFNGHPDLWYCVDVNPGTITHHTLTGTGTGANVTTGGQWLGGDWVWYTPTVTGNCSYYQQIGSPPGDPNHMVWFVFNVSWSSDVPSPKQGPTCYIWELRG